MTRHQQEPPDIYVSPAPPLPARVYPPCVLCGSTDRRLSRAGDLLCPCRITPRSETP